MKQRANQGHGGKRLFLLALLVPGLWGCDIFDEGTPESARVIIEGGGGQQFSLVTSNNFMVVVDENGENREIILNEADTVSTSAPFNQRYSLGSGIRFYVETFRPGGLPEPINVKILVGGDQRFNSTSTLEDLSLEFVYTFR
ncbi:MAG: hypothetical protein ACQET1_01005 [Gemmatimonadota bacterium]